MRRFSMLGMMGMLLLAGCGDNGQPGGAGGQAAEATAQPEAAIQVTAAPQAAAEAEEYKREIAFDIDDISDPVVNDEIKASLKEALEGIVNEDLEQFNRAFTTPELAKANEYGFKSGGGIIFTGVDYIFSQPDGRVVMNVNYNWLTADGEERADSPNYWFMQSKEGKWGLVTID
ncbi:hypothetical protein R70723_13220 [Paenibacillus sp. FSL R7-0273]|uniref:hypothetical protein n=1 Tax=Paenibacillus sp. FSL R7-0273 TaxID=1536772 RepID=UPI0004F79BD8|nr:hypothetical protein [Paenibacillus sp. FSL R7-0273]AIQ46723.1 hypothetical protein R70723_13220 [Paenibacillus sp. FSL R7-0273]OMF97509.1 hypothetical protein BK144_02370 [Paenibacillus sp. FSL R7-0273]